MKQKGLIPENSIFAGHSLGAFFFSDFSLWFAHNIYIQVNTPPWLRLLKFWVLRLWVCCSSSVLSYGAFLILCFSPVEIVFLRGMTMQNAVVRDEMGRSPYAMIAVNPTRIHPSCTEKHLQLVIQVSLSLLFLSLSFSFFPNQNAHIL